jgi:hypothetical protein
MKTPATSLLRKSRTIGVALLCASAAMARAGDSPVDAKAIEPPAPEMAQPWRFCLALPGWLAATSGTIGLDGVNSHVYLGADTLIKNLDMIATFSAEARKGRFGIYGDFLYVSASDGIGQTGLIEKVDVRLAELDLCGKLRTALESRVRSLTDQIEGVDGKRPALPIAPLGARCPGCVGELVRAAIDRRVNELAGALGCQVTRHIHAELGYRYLYTDYNKDGFLYEVSQSGVEITAGITF